MITLVLVIFRGTEDLRNLTFSPCLSSKNFTRHATTTSLSIWGSSSAKLAAAFLNTANCFTLLCPCSYYLLRTPCLSSLECLVNTPFLSFLSQLAPPSRSCSRCHSPPGNSLANYTLRHQPLHADMLLCHCQRLCLPC